jgi:hypothetical protein
MAAAAPGGGQGANISQKPLIPEDFIDVPSQRQFILGLGALCQVCHSGVGRIAILFTLAVKGHKNIRMVAKSSDVRFKCIRHAEMARCRRGLLHIAQEAAHTKIELRACGGVTADFWLMVY